MYIVHEQKFSLNCKKKNRLFYVGSGSILMSRIQICHTCPPQSWPYIIHMDILSPRARANWRMKILSYVILGHFLPLFSSSLFWHKNICENFRNLQILYISFICSLVIVSSLKFRYNRKPAKNYNVFWSNTREILKIFNLWSKFELFCSIILLNKIYMY